MNGLKKYITPVLITTVIIALIGVVYGLLVAGQKEHKAKIEDSRKDTEKKLDKKVDNSTLQLQIQLMREQTKAVQMQIDMTKDQINEIKAKKAGGK